MADPIKGIVHPGFSNDLTHKEPNLFRDGSVVVKPWHQDLIARGKVFTVNFGTDTTVLTFKVGYDEDQPQAVIRVPANLIVVPLFVNVVLEDSAGTDNEIILGVAQNDIGNGTSTDETKVQNLRGDNPAPSKCTFRELYTANSSALTRKIELMRRTYPFADATTDPFKEFNWSYLTHPAPMVGGTSDGGSLILWIAGTTTAPAGFATVTFAEFTKAEMLG